MANDQAPHDWRPLSYILQELRSFDHRVSSALNFFESASAITNAIRSGEVAVRGRRNNGLSSLSPAFERIEKYLGAKSYVDISLNRINIPDDGVVIGLRTRMNPFRLQINPEIFPSSTSVAIPGSGAAGCFTDAEADLRGVEKWIRENALPPRSLSEEEAATEWIRKSALPAGAAPDVPCKPLLDAPLVRKSPEDILNGLIDLKIRPGRHREWTWKRVRYEMVKAAGDDLVKGLSPRNIQRKYHDLVAARRRAEDRRPTLLLTRSDY